MENDPRIDEIIECLRPAIKCKLPPADDTPPAQAPLPDENPPPAVIRYLLKPVEYALYPFLGFLPAKYQERIASRFWGNESIALRFTISNFIVELAYLIMITVLIIGGPLRQILNFMDFLMVMSGLVVWASVINRFALKSPGWEPSGSLLFIIPFYILYYPVIIPLYGLRESLVQAYSFSRHLPACFLPNSRR